MNVAERRDPMSRLAAVSRRSAISLLTCVIALMAAGCGSSNDGTIPPGDADKLISLLDATQSDLQSGTCEEIAGHASQFAEDVSSLPDSVEQSVRDELSKAARNLVTLAKNPDQCGGASGASGAQGVESTSSTTSTTSEPAETSTPETSTSTTEETTEEPPSNNGNNGGGQGNNGAGQGPPAPPAPAPPPPPPPPPASDQGQGGGQNGEPPASGGLGAGGKQ